MGRRGRVLGGVHVTALFIGKDGGLDKGMSMTDWGALLAAAPPARVTEHWPMLRALSGHRGSWRDGNVRAPLRLLPDPAEEEAAHLRTRASRRAAADDVNGALDPKLCAICERPMVRDSRIGYRPNKTQLTCGRECGTELRARRATLK